jgi:hypothetical protein
MITLTRSEVNMLDAVLTALKSGETITVVEDPWFSTAEALKQIDRSNAYYLTWLANKNHVQRKKRDGKSWVYHPGDIRKAAEAIKNKTLRLPRMNSAVG